jgi:WD40 repeat protein
MQATSVLVPCPTTARATPVNISCDKAGAQYAYACGPTVVLRKVNAPAAAAFFSKHIAPVTCVRLSPSGFTCASGDRDGNLFIFTTNADMVVMMNTKPLNGAIKDISWSDDEERMIVVGEGRNQMANVFSTKGGNSIGTMSGHEKTILTCSFKPSRPFRIASGAMDGLVNFYEGPPFKFGHSVSGIHTGNITCVRYSPNAELIATVSSGTDVWLLDGKTGEKVRAVPTNHKGTIYSVEWSADSARVVTASADKTIKVHRVNDGEQMLSVDFGKALPAMQLGACFTSDGIMSFSLSGDINLVDGETGAVARVLHGHATNVKGVAAVAGGGKTVSIGADGKALLWDAAGAAAPFTGDALDFVKHAAPGATADVVLAVGNASIVSYDAASGAAKTLAADVNNAVGVAAMGSAAVAVAYNGKLAVVDAATGKQTAEVKLAGFDATCVAAANDLIAVGGDKGALVFRVAGAALEAVAKFEGKHKSAVAAIAFNAAGTSVASGDTTRQVFVWAPATGAVQYDDLVFHHSHVTCLAFAPGGDDAAPVLASGSVDCSVIVWDLAKKARQVFPAAHHNGVTTLAFAGPAELVTAGSDSCIRRWKW